MTMRALLMLLVAAAIGIACLPASGDYCSWYSATQQYINQTQTPPVVFPCATFNCSHENHWHVKWSSTINCWYQPPHYYPTAKDASMSGSWGAQNVFSAEKGGNFGNTCLDSLVCPRCEDSTSSCALSDLKAYCCI